MKIDATPEELLALVREQAAGAFARVDPVIAQTQAQAALNALNLEQQRSGPAR